MIGSIERKIRRREKRKEKIEQRELHWIAEYERLQRATLGADYRLPQGPVSV